jgi:hypothetical protein
MVMDPLAQRVAAKFAAANVVQLRPRQSGPKVEIVGRHYVLSTDSGPLMGDLAEDMTPPEEGGARLIAPPAHANKWRYLWAYDTENQVLAMWRASDGDEKVFDNAKHQGSQIIRLEKKGQLNRVTSAEFRAIDGHMHRRTQDTIDELKRVVQENKGDAERTVDLLAHNFFEKNVAHHIERAISNIERGATPIGFKPYDPKADAVSLKRQACSFVIGQIFKKEMTEAHLEAYLRQHKFDLDSVHNQVLEWALGDIRDEAYERFLPPR